MHFGFRSLEDYEQWIIDVGGPFAVLVRGLPEEERDSADKAQDAFVPFAADGGYELPGAAPAWSELRTAFEHCWVLSQCATPDYFGDRVGDDHNPKGHRGLAATRAQKGRGHSRRS